MSCNLRFFRKIAGYCITNLKKKLPSQSQILSPSWRSPSGIRLEWCPSLLNSFRPSEHNLRTGLYDRWTRETQQCLPGVRAGPGNACKQARGNFRNNRGALQFRLWLWLHISKSLTKSLNCTLSWVKFTIYTVYLNETVKKKKIKPSIYQARLSVGSRYRFSYLTVDTLFWLRKHLRTSFNRTKK